MSLPRTFGFPTAATLTVWAAVAVGAGWAGLVTVTALTLLEVVFSFDNAVVNAKLLGRLTPWWQTLFLTVGILIAVFGMRALFPVLLVTATSGHNPATVVDLARHHPDQYAAALATAGPALYGFGFAFLAAIAAAFFTDQDKDLHWLGPLERALVPLGRTDSAVTMLLLAAATAVAVTMPGGAGVRLAVLVAAAAGLVAHELLGLAGTLLGVEDRTGMLAGAAAAVMFVRLEVLDASFSFDGVLGAFAVTTSIGLIMAGLGAGAVWVRSLTVHLLRTGTLARFQYLEHGAHWAIAALAAVMAGKIYHLDPPEWVTGSIGVAFIAAAVASSVRRQRKEEPVHG